MRVERSEGTEKREVSTYIRQRWKKIAFIVAVAAAAVLACYGAPYEILRRANLTNGASHTLLQKLETSLHALALLGGLAGHGASSWTEVKVVQNVAIASGMLGAMLFPLSTTALAVKRFIVLDFCAWLEGQRV
ncbi:MAG: hypothetical protein KDK48_06570 [Chlamydiia bacterium]|nr:hypothetical protein [Chlamydiia bacterium]